MKKNIFGRKVIDLTENVIYPNCQCGQELSPFAFPPNQINEDLLNHFKRANLLIEEKDKDGDVVVLLCKKCCKSQIEGGLK